MIGAGVISLVCAIALTFAAAYILDLSPEGVKTFTFISVLFCVAVGQGIRWMLRRGKDPK